MNRSVVHFRSDDAARFAAAREIRITVFCQEQGVPLDIEMDGQDGAATHFLLYEGQSPVATARVRPIAPAVYKIERMAVGKSCRRTGAGRVLMDYILAKLREDGATTAVLHAQIAVEAFYRELGFVAEGDVYMEADIPHRTMRQTLGVKT